METGFDSLINTITVGSKSPSTGGVLDHIQGELIINGSNHDRLVIDDTGSRNTKGGRLTGTTLTGLGLGPKGLTYTGIAQADINLGQVNNWLFVDSTAKPTGYRVNGGDNNDVLYFGAGDLDAIQGNVFVYWCRWN